MSGTAETTANELNRLHTQYENAAGLVASFLSLAKQAIDADAEAAWRAENQLKSIKYASAKHDITLAVAMPDGSISHPSMEQVSERLQAVEHYNQNVVPHFPTLALRMAFIYLVAQFDAFLTDVFEVVMVAEPKILKSGKQLKYDKILEFDSIEELVRYLARRELHEVGYKSMREQAQYYAKEVGVDLVNCGVSIDELAEIQAARNLLVHNNGIVNQKYLEAVPGSTYKVGEAIKITVPYWKKTDESLRKVANHTTQELIKKFGIR